MSRDSPKIFSDITGLAARVSYSPSAYQPYPFSPKDTTNIYLILIPCAPFREVFRLPIRLRHCWLRGDDNAGSREILRPRCHSQIVAWETGQDVSALFLWADRHYHYRHLRSSSLRGNIGISLSRIAILTGFSAALH